MSLSLKFDPKTIQHLGVKMYSTLPPALAELISNSYDADSSQVAIEFFEQNGTPKAITIIDNGTGMSLYDIQNKFLVIGRNRREEEGDKPSIQFGRLPTGKKGLGKLALFGLAKEITVDTIQNGKRNRFRLNWDDLLTSTDTYNPIIDVLDERTERKSGTVIQLSDLKRKTSFDLSSIADSLARIFIVDKNFSINLSSSTGKKLQVQNERRFANISPQFEWTEQELIKPGTPYHGKLKFLLTTSATPIPPSSGLRGVALFSRGKLVNAPEYFSESTSSHFFQYLTGWIQADFIDLLDEDVISTNRQSLNWEHPETSELRAFLSKLISEIAQDWRKRRAAKKEKEMESSTGIDKTKWLNSLPTDVRASVETIVQNLGDGEDVAESFAPVVKALYKIVPEYPLLHWRHLHESLKDGVSDYYKNAQYGHAADQGTKLYAQRLREMSGADLDGAELANLFGYKLDTIPAKPPRIQINELATSSQRNMQDGQGSLTRGLVQAFRNPINHSPMSAVVPNVISELDCLNILSLISYLTTRLDNATINNPTS